MFTFKRLEFLAFLSKKCLKQLIDYKNRYRLFVCQLTNL